MNRRAAAMRRREVLMHRRIALFMIISVVLVLFVAVFLSSLTAKASESEISYKYYTSIQIQDGDTLWSIADKYISTDYKDKNAYISEVIQLNHLSDDVIHEGQHLTVPYYAVQK